MEEIGIGALGLIEGIFAMLDAMSIVSLGCRGITSRDPHIVARS